MASTRETNAAAILLYHRVGSPASDVYGLCVTPCEFQEHMACLRSHYKPIALDELAEAARLDQIPPRAVAVTFDDGYEDNYAVASPILQESGVPATFFLTTENIDNAHEYWWDRLSRILLSDAPLPSALRIELSWGLREFPICTPEDRSAAHEAIYRSLLRCPVDERDRIIEALTDWSGVGERMDPAPRRMTANEIVALAARDGHDVGAHSVSHVMLSEQPVAAQRQEATESRRALEALIGRAVRSFAYPFGAASAETVSAVEAASFDTAVTTEAGTIRPGLNPLLLPRLEVKSRNGAPFAKWLEGQFLSAATT